MVRLSASIMAHPDRQDLVDELRQDLRFQRSVPIAWDREGPPSGNSDRVWRNARRGWEMANPDADWHVLLQDDAVVCADFLDGLESALERVPPDAVVSPYLGRGGATPHRWARMAADADQRESSWVVSTKLMWGVAICLPTSAISDMIEMADRMTGIPDDMRVAGWAQKRRLPVWYTWPSLVDHRAVPSITKHRAKERRAERHHVGSALDLNWDRPVTFDPMYVRERGHRSGPRGDWRVTSAQQRAGTRKAGKRA